MSLFPDSVSPSDQTNQKSPTAYRGYLADRVRQRLASAHVTGEKKMMGGLIFMVNHNMCVGIDIDKSTSQDRLMVRVGKASHDQLIFTKGSREMDFTGKVMRGFLFVSPEGFDNEEDWDFWVAKALEFNVGIGK